VTSPGKSPPQADNPNRVIIPVLISVFFIILPLYYFDFCIRKCL
jgi:hypothetical protein